VEAHQAAVNVPLRESEAAKEVLAYAQRMRDKGLGGSAEEVKAKQKLVKKAEAATRAAKARLKAVELRAPTVDVKLAQTNVEAKKVEVDKAEYALSLCTIKAPVKGTVLRCMLNEGEIVGPTQHYPALTFCPSGPRIVRAEVEQEFAGMVKLGQAARIHDDSTGEGEWRGKVTRLSDWYTPRRSKLLEPLQYNDVRTLECIIQLEPDAKKPLRIGQRVRVELPVGK
jgi:multidrug resistance efflux pump